VYNLQSVKKYSRGFTLIEILIVVAIIGILAAVILSQLSIARENARDTQRRANLGQIQRAMELYYDDNFSYPVLGNANNLNIVGTGFCDVDGDTINDVGTPGLDLLSYPAFNQYVPEGGINDPSDRCIFYREHPPVTGGEGYTLFFEPENMSRLSGNEGCEGVVSFWFCIGLNWAP
jgi:prepilin-type N-terminal cleavage/methylation domain-containing protein